MGKILNNQSKKIKNVYIHSYLNKKTVRYHFSCIKLVKVKKHDKTFCWLCCRGGNRHSYTLRVGMKNGTTVPQRNLVIPIKTAYVLTFESAIPLLEIYPEDMPPSNTKIYICKIIYCRTIYSSKIL